MNRLIRVKGAGFLPVLCLGFFLFFASNSSANNVPPSPTNSFYGDATGDMIIDAADIAQMKAWTLGLTYAYDTIQPQTPTQDWNTGDVTSDIVIDAADLSAIKSWTLGFSVTIPDKPWVLSNENLPTSGLSPGVPVAFQINLASTVGTTFGRAGIPIVARIDAAGSTTTGSLVGRTCSPLAGSRDQSTVGGDQCAIAVTVTDWYGAPGATKGLTETGTYGFKIISNGTGNLRIVFSIDSYPPGLDIPAISVGIIIQPPPFNPPPSFTTTASTTARQGLAYTYTPAITDPDTGENLSCSLGTLNTCGGSLPADTPGPKPHTCTSYTFTPGAGLQTCQFRIVASDNGAPAATAGQTTTVTINRNPTWSTAPTGISVGTNQVYNAVDGTATDADTGETLTCSANGTSCVGFPVGPTVSGAGVKPTNCYVSFTTPASFQVCNLRIMVSDNGSPAATLGSTIVINISPPPFPPTIYTTGGTTARQGLLYSYTAGTTDGNPADLLTCTLGTINTCAGTLPADTPGVSPHSCPAYTFTPGAGLQSCRFRLVVTDNGAPAMSAGQTTTVTINRAPTWSTAPTNIAGIALGSTRAPAVDGIATDADVPAQILTCSSNGTSCPFTPTVTGSSVAPTSCLVGFTATLTVQTCNLRIVVTDTGTPAATLGSTISITTVNNPPTFTTTGPTTGQQGVLYTYSAGTTDADTGENLTCSLGTLNTCGGTLPADTPGVKPHTCTAYSFTPGAGSQSCQFRLVVTDNGTPAATAGQTTTVTINRNPTWSTMPTDITITGGSVYNTTNGSATDPDVPAQALTCSKVGSDTCSGFDVTVSGSGSGSVSCNVSFTAGLSYQTCSFDMRVSDGTLTTTTRTVNITVNIPKYWTIMVYLDGDNNLETYTISDFNEMERGLAAAIAGGNTDIMDNMNVIVMIDRITGYNEDPTESSGSNWTDTRLYRVLPDSITTDAYFRSERLDDGGVGTGHIANLGERNMGDPAQLSFFMNYAKTNFPAAHYELIIWDHGGGTRAPGDPVVSSIKEVAVDDTSTDILYLDEIQQAISANFNSSNKLDVLYFDACLMGMTEVAYEFRNLVKYMVGSMHIGWSGSGALGRYYYLFSHLTGTKDESVITPSDLATLQIDAYKYFIDNYGLNFQGATLAVTDLSQISTLATSVNALAVQMEAAGKKTELETVRDATIHFYDTDTESVGHPFFDLYDFCQLIYNDTGNGFPAGLKTAANNVITSLSNAIVFSYGSDGNGQTSYYGPGSSTHRGLSIVISRGNLIYSGYSHYAYQWWYTAVDTNVWWPGNYYGLIDFCTSNPNGVVESWRELFEKWYDPSNLYTPSSY